MCSTLFHRARPPAALAAVAAAATSNSHRYDKDESLSKTRRHRRILQRSSESWASRRSLSFSDESSPCETTGRFGGSGGGGSHDQLAFDSAGPGDRRPLVEAGAGGEAGGGGGGGSKERLPVG